MIQSIIQNVVSVLNVVVLAVGYYFLVRLYREWIRQSKEERIAGGRPQVVVTADYSHLPEVSLVVRNFTQAPAKRVSFDFSAPVENAEGFSALGAGLFPQWSALPRAGGADRLPLGVADLPRTAVQGEGA